jgi:hypothetical protein
MTDRTQTPSKSSNLSGFIFTILGILMGTAAIISLLQRWTGVEIISDIARDALSLYRQMIDIFRELIFDWWTPLALPWGWSFDMPMWGMDLLTLWLLSAAGMLRVFKGPIEYYHQLSALPGGTDWRRLLMHLADISLFAPFKALRQLQHHSNLFFRFLTGIGLNRVFLNKFRWVPSVHDYEIVDGNIKSFGARIKNAGHHGKKAFFVISPLIGATAFFLWNAIQLTPQ